MVRDPALSLVARMLGGAGVLFFGTDFPGSDLRGPHTIKDTRMRHTFKIKDCHLL